MPLPGHCARASLKHRRRPAPPDARALPPGSLCPGLIEADAEIFGARHIERPLPGHCARASLKPTPAATPGSPGATLPGHCARASLKRLPSALDYAPAKDPPGSLCPGLIEAHAGAHVRYYARRALPGHCARASLKRHHRACALPHLPPLPGHCARASLKLVVAYSRANAVREPSRVTVPGPH